MKTVYKTKGVCSREIHLEIEDGIIKDLYFIGGCEGNLKGISKLCKGQNAESIMNLLRGNTCGFKKTSCPDQLSKAIEVALNK